MFSTDYPNIDERIEIDGKCVPVVYISNDGYGGVVTPSKWTPRCVTMGQLRAFAGLFDRKIDDETDEGGDAIPETIEVELHRVDTDEYQGEAITNFYYVITNADGMGTIYRSKLTVVSESGEVLWDEEQYSRDANKFYQYPFNGAFVGS